MRVWCFWVDTENVASMPALLVYNLRKLWIFLLNQQISGSFYPSINVFFFKNIHCIGKNFKVGHFYMIRKYMNFQIFFNPENWLVDKKETFPCLLLGAKVFISRIA